MVKQVNEFGTLHTEAAAFVTKSSWTSIVLRVQLLSRAGEVGGKGSTGFRLAFSAAWNWPVSSIGDFEKPAVGSIGWASLFRQARLSLISSLVSVSC